MNIQRDTEYRFGELVQAPEYSNEQGVVVTIKSLATGQTMKVYLDEPTQEVDGGINYTNYEGHFYEEEFMFTPSEGFEITGLPLMYQYCVNNDGITNVIDTENHYYMEKTATVTSSMDLIEGGIFNVGFADFPDNEILPDSGNAVGYRFTQFGYEPPIIPIGPA